MATKFELIEESICYDANNNGDAIEDKCFCKPRGPKDQICHDDKCVNFRAQIECIDCSPSCCNKRFQKKEYAKLEVREVEGKGKGLFVLEDINKGGFVLEYVGEVVSAKELQRRMNQSMDQRHLYVMQLKPGSFLDARYKGSISRYINHSCEPNCTIEVWTVAGKIRVGIFATKDIASGTELSFDYRWSPSRRPPTKCLCGTPSCRGYIEVFTKDEEAAAIAASRRGKWCTPEEECPIEGVQSTILAWLKDRPHWLVGKWVEVWWAGNLEFFEALVLSYNETTMEYTCRYSTDGEKSAEKLLSSESPRWKWLNVDIEPEEEIKKLSDTNMDDIDAEYVPIELQADNENDIIVNNNNSSPIAQSSSAPTSAQKQDRVELDISVRLAETLVPNATEQDLWRLVKEFLSADGMKVTTLIPPDSSHGAKFALQGPSTALRSLLSVVKSKEAYSTIVERNKCIQNWLDLCQSTRKKLGHTMWTRDWRLLIRGSLGPGTISSPPISSRYALDVGDISHLFHSGSSKSDQMIDVWDAWISSTLSDMGVSCVGPSGLVPILSLWEGAHFLSQSDSDGKFKSNSREIQDSRQSIETIAQTLHALFHRLQLSSSIESYAVMMLIRFAAITNPREFTSISMLNLVCALACIALKVKGEFKPKVLKRLISTTYSVVYGMTNVSAESLDNSLNSIFEAESAILHAVKFDVFFCDIISLLTPQVRTRGVSRSDAELFGSLRVQYERSCDLISKLLRHFPDFMTYFASEQLSLPALVLTIAFSTTRQPSNERATLNSLFYAVVDICEEHAMLENPKQSLLSHSLHLLRLLLDKTVLSILVNDLPWLQSELSGIMTQILKKTESTPVTEIRKELFNLVMQQLHTLFLSHATISTRKSDSGLRCFPVLMERDLDSDSEHSNIGLASIKESEIVRTSEQTLLLHTQALAQVVSDSFGYRTKSSHMKEASNDMIICNLTVSPIPKIKSYEDKKMTRWRQDEGLSTTQLTLNGVSWSSLEQLSFVQQLHYFAPAGADTTMVEISAVLDNYKVRSLSRETSMETSSLESNEAFRGYFGTFDPSNLRSSLTTTKPLTIADLPKVLADSSSRSHNKVIAALHSPNAPIHVVSPPLLLMLESMTSFLQQTLNSSSNCSTLMKILGCWARDLSQAVGHLHQHGLISRWIDLDHVAVDPSGFLKLTDLSFVVRSQSNEAMAVPHNSKVPWLPCIGSSAPEVILGGNLNESTSSFAFASAAIQLLSGRPLVKAVQLKGTDGPRKHLQYLYKVLGTPRGVRYPDYDQRLPLIGILGEKIQDGDNFIDAHSRLHKVLPTIFPDSILQFLQSTSGGCTNPSPAVSTALSRDGENIFPADSLLRLIYDCLQLVPEKRTTIANILAWPCWQAFETNYFMDRFDNIQQIMLDFREFELKRYVDKAQRRDSKHGKHESSEKASLEEEAFEESAPSRNGNRIDAVFEYSSQRRIVDECIFVSEREVLAAKRDRLHELWNAFNQMNNQDYYETPKKDNGSNRKSTGDSSNTGRSSHRDIRRESADGRNDSNGRNRSHSNVKDTGDSSHTGRSSHRDIRRESTDGRNDSNGRNRSHSNVKDARDSDRHDSRSRRYDDRDSNRKRSNSYDRRQYDRSNYNNNNSNNNKHSSNSDSKKPRTDSR